MFEVLFRKLLENFLSEPASLLWHVCVCVMVLFSLDQYSSTKTILVRNVGNREGKFQLETDP